ncbi:Dap1 protein [Starmerella bacillaris]|uniref:Dap1 protein n=1 Tax=Starmerella bacillaris TaxID=1247836 RepID=A0AAV5RFU4_STABA|nr:Dap1 protein [Starmerella bacillaris]
MFEYIGWVVLAVLTLLAVKVFKDLNSSGVTVDENIPDVLEIQDFTPKTLAKYNGTDDKRILVAVRGKVYDVSGGKKYYGPDGPYAFMAGHDASRALAKHSFGNENLTPLDEPIDTLEGLNEEEWAALNQWIEFFASKYTFCGNLVNP